jgi:hypothetical protein
MFSEYLRGGGNPRAQPANLEIGGQAPYKPAEIPTQFDPQMGYDACPVQGPSNQNASVVPAWYYQPNLLVPAIQRQAWLNASGWGQRYNPFARQTPSATTTGS